MKNNSYKDGIVILDFGSQYTQLIARRIREKNVFSEILNSDTNLNDILARKPAGIIISGGPRSVYDKDAPKFDKRLLRCELPIMGICYGLHILTHYYGGLVESAGKGEYGLAVLDVKCNKGLLNGVSSSSKVWMSHGDHVVRIPNQWQILAYSSNGIVAALANENQTRVATQFHPEVNHTIEGDIILNNFLFNIANCVPNWTPNNFIKEQVELIQNQVGNNEVIVGVSGGVDSTVVAALINKAIGDKSHAVLIDHGLMRINEARECIKALKIGLGVNIHSYDESTSFLDKLKNITEPEEKRKIIGNQFIRSFDRIAGKIKGIKFLAQGTLYPDIIESGVNKGNTAQVIKSHHNVGGLPDNMQLDLVEPLKELFKDEVRNVGRELGLPDSLIKRHPFPGPGLGIRIIGEITKKRIRILQLADQIFISVLIEDNLYDLIWQAFCVLIPVKTVGVMGDHRTYENLLALRAVTSVDGMTADWFHLPHETLSKISNQIINSVPGINRVVYDITSKPPGTIEWE